MVNWQLLPEKIVFLPVKDSTNFVSQLHYIARYLPKNWATEAYCNYCNICFVLFFK